ncbi:MAG: hypothetical protein RRB13_11600 [bacterium]|nr:hypothetical protein [bacterium]
MRSLLALCFSLIFLAPMSLMAWDFSDLRQQLKADLGTSGPERPRLAVVFKTVKREQLKQNFNLVTVKKELAHELVRSFQVPDPLITAEVLRQNNLTVERLMADSKLTEELAQRTQAELVLMVSLTPEGENLVVDAKLVTTRNQPLSNQHLVLTPNAKKVVRLSDAPLVAQPVNQPVATSAPVASQERSLRQPKSLFAQFGDMIPKDFMADHNDSWMEINPTAYINPLNNYLELSVWANNLADTDVRFKRLRYDVAFSQIFQVGIEGFGNDDSGPHSGYGHAKVQVVNLQEFSLAVGYRRRVYWNPENPDFALAPLVDEFNDRRNKSTLYAALSRKDSALGMMFNVYLDNQRVGAGAKYLLTEDIKLVADAYQNYYEKPLIQNDGALGIQIYNPMGTMFGLMYRVDSEQVHASFGYSF